MRLSQNYWFRWFAGGLSVGAVVALLAWASGELKDFKVELVWGKFSYGGTWAWITALVIFGAFSGLLGLSVAGLNTLVTNKKDAF